MSDVGMSFYVTNDILGARLPVVSYVVQMTSLTSVVGVAPSAVKEIVGVKS